MVVWAVLARAGFHQHARGEWRLRRHEGTKGNGISG
jgi:hypothetical protein